MDDYEEGYLIEQENYWEDDLYQMNQNEADDYRHENDDFDGEDDLEEWDEDRSDDDDL